MIYPYVVEIDGFSIQSGLGGAAALVAEPLYSHELQSVILETGMMFKNPVQCKAGYSNSEPVGYRFTFSGQHHHGDRLAFTHEQKEFLQGLQMRTPLELKENVSDRGEERLWLGCYLAKPARFELLAAGRDRQGEYWHLTGLELIWVKDDK